MALISLIYVAIHYTRCRWLLWAEAVVNTNPQAVWCWDAGYWPTGLRTRTDPPSWLWKPVHLWSLQQGVSRRGQCVQYSDVKIKNKFACSHLKYSQSLPFKVKVTSTIHPWSLAKILALLHFSCVDINCLPSILLSQNCWWSQTNDLKIDTSHFLARRSALLGYG